MIAKKSLYPRELWCITNTYYRYVSQRLHLLSLQLTFYKNIILTYNGTLTRLQSLQYNVFPNG